MKNESNRLLLWMLSMVIILAGIACAETPGDKETEKSSVSAPLTMEQAANGKWVVMDGSKNTMYEVFIYDNGPDYPSEGLLRIVQNGKIGYANATTYAIVIEPQFDCAFPFENGKAKVSKQCQTVKDGEYSVWESDNWQYVDKQGDFTKQD